MVASAVETKSPRSRWNKVHPPFPYSGSRRLQSETIVSYLPCSSERRLVEAFGGSAAVTLCAAQKNLFGGYWINDFNVAVLKLWNEVIYNPHSLATAYKKICQESNEVERVADYYAEIRERFNEHKPPADFLWLLIRMHNNKPHYNVYSKKMTQKIRYPHRDVQAESIINRIEVAHELLESRTLVTALPFLKLVERQSRDNEVWFIDPPWPLAKQDATDLRYDGSISWQQISPSLQKLGEKNIPFALVCPLHISKSADVQKWANANAIKTYTLPQIGASRSHLPADTLYVVNP